MGLRIQCSLGETCTLEGFHIKSKIGGEKRLHIYLRCSSTRYCFLGINIPLDLGGFLGLNRSQQPLVFSFVYTVFWSIFITLFIF